MKVQTKQVTQLVITEIQNLDPVTVVLEDLAPGKGKIIISCYTQSWNAYWGAMGNRTIAEFFGSCDEHYLANSLSSTRSSVVDTEGIEAFAKKHVIKLRKQHDIGADEAREFFDEIERADFSDPFREPAMPIIVFNKHSQPDMTWCDEVVNVMRPTVLGNPFPISRTATREVVIARYRQWLHEKLQDPSSPQSIEIGRLDRLHQQGKNVALLCCCAPLACHADVIKEVVVGQGSA